MNSKKRNIYLVAFVFSVAIFSCKKDKEVEIVPQEDMINTVPEFYNSATPANYGKNLPAFTVIATSANKLETPQDIDFNPDPSRPNELWVINKETEMSGGSTVMFLNPGTGSQTFDYRKDGNALHFMSLPSGIAFGDNGNWATTTCVADANHSGGTFTGPTLWSGNLDIYARPSGGNGSHLDMLHASPFSMGIAHDSANVYWVFDGYNGHIVRYDFVEDHGPGNDDHSDGTIHRYMEVSVNRHPTEAIPGHLILDKNSGWLYVCDVGNKRVLRLNTKTGAKKSDLMLINEPLAEHWEIKDVEWEVFIDSGIETPCGIEINENRLFVSDYLTGEIIAYDVNTKKELARIQTGSAGITGIKVGPSGKLWYVNSLKNELIRLDPL